MDETISDAIRDGVKERMKNIIRRSLMGRALAALLCALLLAGALSAGGALGETAQTGGLKVMLKADTYAQLPKDADVTFTLYQIGTADPSSSAGWKINDDLTDYGVLAADTSGKLGEIATRMAADVKGRYPGTEQKLVSGAAKFTGLQEGVYLGAMTKGPAALKVIPFIVTIPARNPETQKVEYDYDVTVKDEYSKSTPKPTPKPTPNTTPPPGDNPTPPPTTRVTGQKVWVDEGNRYNTRPDSITVQLYANGELVDAKPSWTNTSTDNWSYAFNNLPAEKDGAAIEYTVDELPVDGYDTEITGTTITNKLIPKEPTYKEFSGVKTWKDNDNEEGLRPGHITVRLLCDGHEVASRVVTAATGWKYSFGRQPVDDGYGNKHTYTLKEDAVEGYYNRINGLNVTNTRLPEKPKTPGEKKKPSKFNKLTAEELDELTDLFEYDTPLWGGLLGTGDETPVWPYAFAGAGMLAVAALLVLRRRRRRDAR